jgi:hypothetical protein
VPQAYENLAHLGVLDLQVCAAAQNCDALQLFRETLRLYRQEQLERLARFRPDAG